jgi:transposase-like protein
MSVVDGDGDPPPCPSCNSATDVAYTASVRDPSGGLVPEFTCRACSRAFTAAESEEKA